MLNVGDVAPDFTLTAHDGSEVTLSDLQGRKVVIYFYPKADTPGCTRQACAIREESERPIVEGDTLRGAEVHSG